MSAKNPSAKNRSAKNPVPSTKNSPAARKPLPASRNAVLELQRQLLIAGIKQPDGRLRFAKSSAETLATTYGALLSLQRKKLIAPEKAADPHMMSWKITKAGKALVAEKPSRRR